MPAQINWILLTALINKFNRVVNNRAIKNRTVKNRAVKNRAVPDRPFLRFLSLSNRANFMYFGNVVRRTWKL